MPTTPTIVTLDQQTDTPARREILPGAVLTYLYDRSLDSKKSRAPGQDFIAYAYDERQHRLAFAVCDGVSQSFYGELAARFVGERLVAWLAAWPLADDDEQDFAAHVEEALCSWTDEATRRVQARPVSSALPPMVQKALEKKRENGSEAMFVAGLLDFTWQRYAVCWMGDLRMWLWDRNGEPVDLPGAAWHTRERWSTRVGPKNGKPRAALLPFDLIGRITIHTDGVGSHAPELHTMLRAADGLDRLDQLARVLEIAPGSDDVSILDIALTRVQAPPLAAPEPYQPDADEPVIRWAAVGGADWYRVEIVDGDRQWTVDTGEVTFFVPGRSTGDTTCRVRALSSDRAPSHWSSPVTLRQAIPAEAESAVLAPEPAPELELAPEEAVVVTGYRPFRTGVVLLISIVLALVLTVGWILLYAR